MTGAIDFSQLTDLAERYRANEKYEQAAAVYRGLSEGLAENMNLVDGAYDHYAKTFQAALDGYVECIGEAALDADAFQDHVDYLAARTDEAVDYLATRYATARNDLAEQR